MATPTVQNKPVARTPEWYLESQFEQIKMALPRHIDADRMRRICLTELRKNDKLREAANRNPLSFFGSVIQAAQLGLEPGSGLGHCYLIPYGQEVQFQIGYQGMIELVMRTGKLASLKTGVVCEGELFIYETTHEGEIFRHMPDLEIDIRDESNIKYVYAIARLKGSDIPIIEVMTKAQINANEAKNRKGQNRSGPWKDYWSEMARKTLVRRMYKMLPKNPEMVEFLERDDEGGGNMAEIARKHNLDRTMGGSSSSAQSRSGAGSVLADIMDAEATVTTSSETNPV